MYTIFNIILFDYIVMTCNAVFLENRKFYVLFGVLKMWLGDQEGKQLSVKVLFCKT